MNTIFLDIDGVLNSNFWNNTHQKEISDGTLIDYEKIELLGLLVKDTSSQIILHSGWKYWFDQDLSPLRVEAQNLLNLLKEQGLTIAGITPDLATEEIKQSKKFSLIKAEEILLWISTHPLHKWIVIDDLDLHNNTVRAHQIFTDPHIGLTLTDVNKAKELFNIIEKG